MKKLLLILSLCFWSLVLYSQDKTYANVSVRERLSLLISEYPQLEEEIDFDVQNVPLGEFLMALGKNNELNISTARNLDQRVRQTFTQIALIDLLSFVCENYNLDFKLVSNVLYFFPEGVPKYVPQIHVFLNPNDSTEELINLNLRNDSLEAVAREITKQSKINLLFAPEVRLVQLNVLIKNTNTIEALEQIADIYKLQLDFKDTNLYVLSQGNPGESKSYEFEIGNSIEFGKPSEISNSRRDSLDQMEYHIQTSGAPLKSVVLQLLNHFEADFILMDEINGNIQADIKGRDLAACLSQILSNTEYTFKYDEPYYVIGSKDQESLVVSYQIQLFNRPVHKILDFIPGNLVQKLEVIEFDELNSVLVTGFYPDIRNLEHFIKQIDKRVPVVMIEVIIVDYQKNSDVSTGIDAGVGANPATSGGVLYPGVEYNLNAASLNNLIQSFNGFGSLNLGAVSPNFYVNLQLLETNGIINVKSTPRITTLNGHEASISIGNTEYYVVEQTNITGVQNPIPVTIRNYQSVQANFSLTIKPYVSNDNQVTMDIQVEQTDFTARIAPEAPPGNVSRTFNSYIRVENEDMILLGGLEEKGFNSVGSGLPFLSRVWGLKWIFGNRNRTDNKSKLNIFIKPVIIQ